MTPRGVSTTRRPEYNLAGRPCKCHKDLRWTGHHFGDDLRCVNGACFATWAEQQEHRTHCTGLWVQQRGREEEEC